MAVSVNFLIGIIFSLLVFAERALDQQMELMLSTSTLQLAESLRVMASPKKSPAQKSTHTVPILRKAMRVLESVAQVKGTAATTKSLALSLQIPGSTCYRILQTFVESGWLRPSGGGSFELSFGLVPLLRPLLRHEVLIELVREPLAALAKTTSLTAKLSVRQAEYAVTIFSAPSPKPTAITSRVGSLSSLAIGSSGASFLSTMDDAEVADLLGAAPPEAWRHQKRYDVWRRIREIRREGICYDKGSYQPNINTLSARLFARNEKVVAVITLLGFPDDFSGAKKRELVRQLKDTVQGINQAIQGTALGDCG